MTEVRTEMTLRLEPAAWEQRTWWYEPSGMGFGAVQLGLDGRSVLMTSPTPAALRALAGALSAAAEQLDRLYAEHGVQPPAAADPGSEADR